MFNMYQHINAARQEKARKNREKDERFLKNYYGEPEPKTTNEEQPTDGIPATNQITPTSTGQPIGQPISQPREHYTMGMDNSSSELQSLKDLLSKTEDPNKYTNELVEANKRADGINNDSSNKWGKFLSIMGAAIGGRDVKDVAKHWKDSEKAVIERETKPILEQQTRDKEQLKAEKENALKMYDMLQRNNQHQQAMKYNYDRLNDELGGASTPKISEKDLQTLTELNDLNYLASQMIDKETGEYQVSRSLGGLMPDSISSWGDATYEPSKKQIEDLSNAYARTFYGDTSEKTMKQLRKNGQIPSVSDSPEEAVKKIKALVERAGNLRKSVHMKYGSQSSINPKYLKPMVDDKTGKVSVVDQSTRQIVGSI